MLISSIYRRAKLAKESGNTKKKKSYEIRSRAKPLAIFVCLTYKEITTIIINKTMAKTALKGNPVNTSGDLPKNGTTLPSFKLVKTDLSEAGPSDFKGKRLLLNIFPSLETGVCAMSIRKFNEKAAGLDNTVVLAISKDVPFAMGRFCTTEGINNVVPLSGFRDTEFGKSFGVDLLDGPMKGLYARSVVIADESGKVIYTELVPEISTEPDYDKALAAL